MLKSVTICMMLVATVALGWQRYGEDDAPFSVQHGTSLTWGSDGRVWGWFPVSGTNTTYIGIFDPNAEEDSMWDDSTAGAVGPRVDGAGCTFQWMEQPVFWGCGWRIYGPSDTVCNLYCYYPDNDSADTVSISAFNLGEGSTIAYDPNRLYNAQNYAVPGWIYCLTDDPYDGRSFWRYAVPGGWYVPPGEFTGFYPDSGAIISTLTPHLAWGSSGSVQYRIQVSNDPNFVSNSIDSVIADPEYVFPSELDNGTYYWRTASWVSSAWSWTGAHSFDLQGGWQRLADIPIDVEEGAVIAYDSGSFSDAYRSILALPGGSVNAFLRYKIGQNTWSYLASAAGEEEGDGTCLTTRTPTYEGDPLVMARFSTQGKDDVPSQYNGLADHWADWVVQGGSLYRSDFPRPMVYSAMVLGGGFMYMLPGGYDDEKDFYQVVAPGGGEGGEGVASQVREANAHAIAGSDGIEVEYQLPAAAHVRATLHDAVGREIGHLDAGEQQRGVHRLSCDRDSDGRRLNAGAYFVVLDTGTEQTTLKAVVK